MWLFMVEEHVEKVQCKVQLVLTNHSQVICVFNCSKVIFWSKFTIFGHFSAIMVWKVIIFFAIVNVSNQYTTFKTKIWQIGQTVLKLLAKNPNFRVKFQKIDLRKWKWSVFLAIFIKRAWNCLARCVRRSSITAPKFSSVR